MMFRAVLLCSFFAAFAACAGELDLQALHARRAALQSYALSIETFDGQGVLLQKQEARGQRATGNVRFRLRLFRQEELETDALCEPGGCKHWSRVECPVCGPRHDPHNPEMADILEQHGARLSERASFFDFVFVREERVGERPCQHFQTHPKYHSADARETERFWLDADTGILLRWEKVDGKGAVLRSERTRIESLNVPLDPTHFAWSHPADEVPDYREHHAAQERLERWRAPASKALEGTENVSALQFDFEQITELQQGAGGAPEKTVRRGKQILRLLHGVWFKRIELTQTRTFSKGQRPDQVGEELYIQNCDDVIMQRKTAQGLTRHKTPLDAAPAFTNPARVQQEVDQVLALLDPESGQAVKVEQGSFEGESCRILRAGEASFWIDAKGLLRKAEWLSAGSKVTEYYRAIRINVETPVDAFHLPPNPGMK